MDFMIDNYYIATSFDGIMSISIAGQNIILDRFDPRGNICEKAYKHAMMAIENYNKHHGLEWGKIE